MTDRDRKRDGEHVNRKISIAKKLHLPFPHTHTHIYIYIYFDCGAILA